MSQTHYKLPIDEIVDKDIIDWINSFPRNKKGEMVRHAIRYYMSQLGEGETIKFPSNTQSQTKEIVKVIEPEKKVKKKAVINKDMFKSKK